MVGVHSAPLLSAGVVLWCMCLYGVQAHVVAYPGQPFIGPQAHFASFFPLYQPTRLEVPAAAAPPTYAIHALQQTTPPKYSTSKLPPRLEAIVQRLQDIFSHYNYENHFEKTRAETTAPSDGEPEKQTVADNSPATDYGVPSTEKSTNAGAPGEVIGLLPPSNVQNHRDQDRAPLPGTTSSQYGAPSDNDGDQVPLPIQQTDNLASVKPSPTAYSAPASSPSGLLSSATSDQANRGQQPRPSFLVQYGVPSRPGGNNGQQFPAVADSTAQQAPNNPQSFISQYGAPSRPGFIGTGHLPISAPSNAGSAPQSFVSQYGAPSRPGFIGTGHLPISTAQGNKVPQGTIPQSFLSQYGAPTRPGPGSSLDQNHLGGQGWPLGLLPPSNGQQYLTPVALNPGNEGRPFATGSASSDVKPLTQGRKYNYDLPLQPFMYPTRQRYV